MILLLISITIWDRLIVIYGRIHCYSLLFQSLFFCSAVSKACFLSFSLSPFLPMLRTNSWLCKSVAKILQNLACPWYYILYMCACFHEISKTNPLNLPYTCRYINIQQIHTLGMRVIQSHPSNSPLRPCFTCQQEQNVQLYWTDLLKNVCTHVDHNQLDDPLPLKSYTPPL